MGQGAKAMLCTVKGVVGHVLAVLPGDQRVDFKKVGQTVGGQKASLANAEQAQQLTGCVMGAVPPFALVDGVRLVVDPSLLERYDEIAFNAGRLDRSIVLNSQIINGLHCLRCVPFVFKIHWFKCICYSLGKS